MLDLYETPQQKKERERRRFTVHVQQEVQKFQQRKVEVDRSLFRKAVGARTLQLQRREEGRANFRNAISPTIDQEVQRFNQRREDVGKFRSAIGERVDALSALRRDAGIGGLQTFAPEETAQQVSESQVATLDPQGVFNRRGVSPQMGYAEPGGGGISLGDIANQVNRRVLEPSELIGGRIVQSATKTLPMGTQAQFGGSTKAGGEEAVRVGGDIEAAANALVGSEEDSERLRARLNEIGISNRIVGGLLFDPLNLVPGLGIANDLDTLRFLRGVNKIKGAGSVDDIARMSDDEVQFAIEALRGRVRGAGRAADDAPGTFQPIRGTAVDDVVPLTTQVDELAPTSTWDDTVSQIRDSIRIQRQNIKANKPVQSAERGGRLASSEEVYQQVLAETGDRAQAQAAKRAAQSGSLSQAEQVALELPEEQAAAIWNRVDSFDFGRGFGADFERDRVRGALLKLEGAMPGPLQNNELKSLEKVLGPDLVRDIRSLLKKNDKGGWDTLFDWVVAPKAVLSSADLSYPLRQGIMLAPGRPREFGASFKPMVEAFASEGSAQRIFADIAGDPTQIRLATGEVVERGAVKQRTGLIRALDPESTAAEEVFRSTVAERVPLVRRSNRAFTTFGNKFRSDVFDTVVKHWENSGVDITAERLQGLSNLLNRLTGRGVVGNTGATKAMQALWWSPQYRLAGPQAAAQLMNRDGALRYQAWRGLASFMGTGLTLLGAAKLSGLGDVEIDPRSTDFGKVQIGDTRINIWGTNQTLIRTIAQAASGQRITQAGDLLEASDKTRRQAIERYIRSGLAPEWGAVWDMIAGETFLGEPASLRPEHWDNAAKENLLPLVAQDALEALTEEGISGLAGIPPAFFGLGVQTYSPSLESQAWEMPRYQGITKDQERELYDFLDEVEMQYQQARRAGAEVTKADVALGLGQATDRAGLGAMAAAQIREELPLNGEQLAFVIDNQDNLDGSALSILPIVVAREALSDANFQKYLEARQE